MKGAKNSKMKLLLLLCALRVINSHTLPEHSGNLERTVPNIAELIRQHGYESEEHSVVTEDGYILRIHRIPPKTGVKPKNQTVFLMHGLLCSSADWIVSGPGNALAYILSDEGYDVWMGNARGNTQSRNHTDLDPDRNKHKFWDFSWHEIGYYDLPAMIDFVLETTGHSDLFHIGHSQGTTSFYVMASMRPEYNAKIRAHFSLAPIAFMNHMTSPLVQLSSFFNRPLSMLLNLIGLDEYLPSNELVSILGGLFCSDYAITQILCTNSLFVIAGFSPNEMNATMLPDLMKYTPAGAATKQFLHYGQEVRSGHFRRYDHGTLGNLARYGKLRPPDYKLEKITAPVYLLYSHNDWLAAEVDVLKLYERLANPNGRFLIAEGSFNHLDFLYGIHAREYVYDRVVSLMARHNN